MDATGSGWSGAKFPRCAGAHGATPVGIPAYFGPWEQRSWQRLIADAPSIVVLNPSNGPGQTPSLEYRSLRESLRERGTRVLLYVHTAYLTRELKATSVDVERSHSWFDADGVFFDEVPVDDSRSVRSKLDQLADLSPNPCAFNAGRVVPETWFARYPLATFVTFEGSPDQLAERSGVGGPSIEGPPERQWWLLHSAPKRTHADYWNSFSALGLGFGYVTNDRLPNPWDVYAAPATYRNPKNGGVASGHACRCIDSRP